MACGKGGNIFPKNKINRYLKMKNDFKIILVSPKLSALSNFLFTRKPPPGQRV